MVLLTHPFSLTEPDVAAARRRLRPGQRLFGLAVDGEGQVELSELRQGVPLRVSRFHVDLEPRPEEAPQPAVEPWQPWRGDVEPVGYPFRFGVEHDTKPTLLFAFDHAGDWLLTATVRTACCTPPRPMARRPKYCRAAWWAASCCLTWMPWWAWLVGSWWPAMLMEPWWRFTTNGRDGSVRRILCGPVLASARTLLLPARILLLTMGAGIMTVNCTV